MRRFGLALSIVLLAGCSTASTDYYQAVEKAAQANALAAQAKFDALSKIAAAGDGQAASAAVMALAMTQTPSVQPVPQQSTALQWASVLASPVTSLGMMWLQADSAKTMARYNAKVDLAQVQADAQTQQALYGSFSDISTAGFSAVGNVDYTPFIDGMVTLGTTGMDNLTNLGTAGFDANTTIATNGMNSLTTLGTHAQSQLYGLGTNGMTNLTTLGTNALNVGALNTSNWLNYAQTSNGIWKDILATEQKGCIATTNANNQIVVTCN